MSKPETTTLRIGDRVRLAPSRDWLSRYAPLAEHGRPGTITGLPDERTADVTFDVKRPGAKPVSSTFARADLMPCAVPAPVEQEGLKL